MDLEAAIDSCESNGKPEQLMVCSNGTRAGVTICFTMSSELRSCARAAKLNENEFDVIDRCCDDQLPNRLVTEPEVEDKLGQRRQDRWNVQHEPSSTKKPILTRKPFDLRSKKC